LSYIGTINHCSSKYRTGFPSTVIQFILS